MTYRFPIHVGDRVAIAPHHDLWMAGCRFGTVVFANLYQAGVSHYTLRLDTGREVTLPKSDLLGAVGPYNQPARPAGCDGLPLDQTTCPDRAAHM